MNRVDPRNFSVYGRNHVKSKWSTSKSCPVSRPMALVFKVSAFAGAAPVVVADGRMMCSKRMHIFCCIFVGILVAVSLVSMAIDVNQDYRYAVCAHNTLTTFVWGSDVAFVTMASSLCVATGLYRMRKVTQILRRLEEMALNHNKCQQRRSSRRLYLLMLGSMVCVVALLVYDFGVMFMQTIDGGRHWKLCCCFVTMYILYMFVMLEEMQFILIALAVADFLKAINDELVGHLDRVNKKIYVSNDLSERIRHLAMIHADTCDLIHQLDKAAGRYLLLIILFHLQHLISLPYHMIDDIFNNFPIFVPLIKFMWCVYHLTTMCAVIEPCHITEEELKRTRELLSKLYGHVTSTTEPLSQQLELFCRQLVMKRVEYSPMGIFTMNRPLIAQIVGAVTTYLVIILQFQEMVENNF